MSVNKVVYGGKTLIDLSSDTVASDKLFNGYTAHDKAGNAIVGTLVTKKWGTGTYSPDWGSSSGVIINENPNLPSTYTQVEYIESSGTQYIDTGFKPNQDTGVDADAEFKTQTSGQWLFGSRTSANNNAIGILTYKGKYRFDYNATTKFFDNSASFDSRFVVSVNKNVSTLNGTITNTIPYAEFSSGVNLFLFANNNGGSVASNGAAKLYSCQIYDNGTLVRDYIPCLNSDGAAGLYDLVNGVFYTNAGTGTFSYGSARRSKQWSFSIPMVFSKESMLQFPFSNESLTEPLIAMSETTRFIPSIYVVALSGHDIMQELQRDVQVPDTVSITASNISSYFSVSNGNYYFKGSGSTFTTTNGGVHSSTATTTLTAKYDMTVSFTYSYSSEGNCDKFTLVVAGSTIEKAVSGSTKTKSGSWAIKAGQKIEFTYSKDGSVNSNDDKCTFSKMTLTYQSTVQETYEDTLIPVGTTRHNIAADIPNQHIVVSINNDYLDVAVTLPPNAVPTEDSTFTWFAKE